MQNIIVFTGAEFPFRLFSAAHLIPLTILLSLSMLIYVLKRRLLTPSLNKPARYAIAGLLLLQEGSYHIWAIVNDCWYLGYSLPLHICGVSALLSGIMLITRSYPLFEVVYFWGLAGATQALLTPDIGDYSFPHYMYYKFFTSHSLIILAVLFMTFVESYRPSVRSLGKVFLVTNAYAAVVASINYLTGGNYLYLCGKPQGPSLLDYLGPWPWYIFSLELVVALSFIICYLPYLTGDIANKRTVIIRHNNE